MSYTNKLPKGQKAFFFSTPLGHCMIVLNNGYTQDHIDQVKLCKKKGKWKKIEPEEFRVTDPLNQSLSDSKLKSKIIGYMITEDYTVSE